MLKKLIFGLLLVLHITLTFSQDKKKFLTLEGYISSVQSAIFDSISGNILYENLIHNRINLKCYINKNITCAAEFRNRLLNSPIVRMGFNYRDMNGIDQGWADLSWNIIDEQSVFLNTKIDRLWIDFNYDKFQARIGRQRINWGQTLIWNPNDIFNSYSFFDIDYIERPGSDAVRLQYFTGYSSVFEVAVKTDINRNVTAASLYRFNKWGYDIQFIAGYANSEDIVAGAGWSGAIGSVSFRGEATWFQPSKKKTTNERKGIFTIGLDKVLKDNSSAQVQLLYCNDPNELTDFNNLYSGSLSTRDMAFSKFSALGQFTYAVTPLLNVSASGIWFPSLNGYFAGPSIDYSIAENFDFSLFWQHFGSSMSDTKMKVNLVFLKTKLSF
jgi:hypothetical protein